MSIKEEREFQIELLEIQIEHDTITMLSTVLISIGFSIIVSFGVTFSAVKLNWIGLVQLIIGVLMVLVSVLFWQNQTKKTDDKLKALKEKRL